MDPIKVADNISPFVIYIICSLPLVYFAIRHGTTFLLNIALRLTGQKKTTDPRGCRRLGLPPGRSNLHDEFDPKYQEGVPSDYDDHHDDNDDVLPNWRIKALFAYPIKSCAGVEFDVADVVGTGLAYDRQFCFAEYVTPGEGKLDGKNSPRWEFRTMRNVRFSKLALIRPEIWVPDPTSPDYSPDLEEVKSQGVLVIYYPRTVSFCRGRFLSSLVTKLGMALGLCAREASFQVPLHPSQGHDYPSVPVQLWKDFPLACDYGRHIPTELREFLSAGTDDAPPLTLFRADPAHYRAIFRCAPRKSELGFQPHTGFADAYPLHMLNLASVQDVARRCSYAIPRLSARRFRANIIIQGPSAYEEDSWKRIRVGGGRTRKNRNQKSETRDQRPSNKKGDKEEDGDSDGVEIYTVCRTVRCRLPNVDPDTGIRHPTEPDRTLKSFRCIDAGDPKNACLGMQLVPAVEEFTIRVGERISVLETGEHFYIKMLAPGDPAVG
ncbi:hypothetical protein VTN77DRAFT_7339 [Rasamsonia byssochlamydoides]|uniref:uncharacterized protein n=1 Tax=Rasamsonia byssochlamydoides TaxID=89139 RepID=UPI003743AA7B